MNVTDRSAWTLLRAFARLEFALKQFPEFVNGEEGDVPDTQWTAYYPLARRAVSENVSIDSKIALLGIHPNDPPPKKMVVTPHGNVDFDDFPLFGPEGDRLIEAARRVRNNVVHGGKEHALQQRYPGHDQRLVDASIDVLNWAASADQRVAALYFDK